MGLTLNCFQSFMLELTPFISKLWWQLSWYPPPLPRGLKKTYKKMLLKRFLNINKLFKNPTCWWVECKQVRNRVQIFFQTLAHAWRGKTTSCQNRPEVLLNPEILENSLRCFCQTLNTAGLSLLPNQLDNGCFISQISQLFFLLL